MPKTKPAPALRDLLVEHVLVTDHLQNLHRAHGDTNVDPACGCGVVLGRVTPADTCSSCGHPREEHRKPHLEGCQHAVVQVRTVAEKDGTGLPTGKTIDVVERGVCECGEFRSVPAAIPKRTDIIDTWLKHSGLPEFPTRDHLLLRVVGELVSSPLPAVVAVCLCGAALPGSLDDPTDPAAAIAAWAEHVAKEA